MAGAMPEHNLLTLDYWQDSVSYEGKTVPSGTIGCEVLKSVVVRLNWRHLENRFLTENTILLLNN